MVTADVSWALMSLVCSYALVRGGRPERIGAVVNVAGSLVTAVLRVSLPSFVWLPGALSVLLIDVMVAACFFWLAVTTIRFWPIWAAGFALSDILMSVGTALLPHVRLFAYHTWIGAYAYLALGALALGTYRLRRDADPVVRNGSRKLWLSMNQRTR